MRRRVILMRAALWIAPESDVPFFSQPRRVKVAPVVQPPGRGAAKPLFGDARSPAMAYVVTVHVLVDVGDGGAYISAGSHPWNPNRFP